MGRVPLPRFDVEALEVLLCERIADLRPLVVADVVSAFLAVSSLPCEETLWSFEFAFDEDDGRIALLEARFRSPAELHALSGEELRGYEVEMTLPHVIPARPLADGVRAADHAPDSGAAGASLVARFVRALGDLGAYRAIETVEARSARVYLL